MNIPLNGRIAIIDDKIDQALPLMRVLSKNQLPYVFYKGNDLSYLPNNDERYNDIRLIFLDINLLNESAAPDKKQLKSTLFSVLKRVVSPENFPYSIILWSRHQDENSDIVNEIFDNELKDRKPINIKNFVKSDYFPNFSDEEVENKIDLLQKIEEIINSEAAYSHLLNWENQVHLSADKTLQDIFSSYHTFPDWQNNANYVLNKLGSAYLGKHFNDCNPEDKIKSSFVAFSSVFKDTLEHSIQTISINSSELTCENSLVSYKVNTINEKLNISGASQELTETGNVLVFSNEDSLFGGLLNKIISFFGLKQIIKIEKPDILEDLLKKETSKSHKKLKKEIKTNWFKIGLVITPLCDFAQKNKVYDRVIKGVMIPIKYKKYVEQSSDAIYLLPITYSTDNYEYLIILDFRYFNTTELDSEFCKPLFRLRQELLAEIQSRTARHINRQGILFIDEM